MINASLACALGLAALGWIAYAVIRLAFAAQKEAGRDALAAEEAARDREAARKQADIMLEDRTVDETAKRLEGKDSRRRPF